MKQNQLKAKIKKQKRHYSNIKLEFINKSRVNYSSDLYAFKVMYNILTQDKIFSNLSRDRIYSRVVEFFPYYDEQKAVENNDI